MLAALAAGLVACEPGAAQMPQAAVKVVRHDDLLDLVRDHKGKVVLVEFWSTTCIPCRNGFHHAVEMQKTYGDKGLVVLTVATDVLDEDKDKTLERIRKFLAEKQATATVNLALDVETKVLTESLRVESLPCIFVFNREGKWKRFIGKDLTPDAGHRYPAVEAWIKEVLAQPK
jgi:thiol-disulfide isomerase/thioredoxin